MPNRIKDITGLRTGKLVAVAIHGRDDKGRALWSMRCDCGATVVRPSAGILKAANDNKASSCGCDHHLKTHGLTNTHRRLQWVWVAMRKRCSNPRDRDFQNYGARGISVCAEWSSFAEFVRWAESSGYRPGVTIERMDVNGNYEPANCIWIPNPMQARNRRNTHLFTHGGVTLDIRAWSERSGVPYYVLRGRLVNCKWDIARAISEPVRRAP